jgi:hypothetical protein
MQRRTNMAPKGMMQKLEGLSEKQDGPNTSHAGGVESFA